MNIELTKEELELINKLLYNEKLKLDYLLKVEKITEFPKEFVSLINKLQKEEEEVE